MTFEISHEGNDPFLLDEHKIESAKTKAGNGNIEVAIFELEQAEEILDEDQKKPRPIIEPSDFSRFTQGNQCFKKTMGSLDSGRP